MSELNPTGGSTASPKLILDAMGGDYAPEACIEGALLALPELQSQLVLIGDENAIRTKLSKRRFKSLRDAIQIVHTSENIEMADSIRAIRSKPNATINLGCKMAAQDWKEYREGRLSSPSAFISAGHSGAMMASALLHMGRLQGVERPAIAVKLPTLSPDGCVLLDVGANVDCKPEHLRDFAVMGAVFSQVERKSSGLPRVGVLSNGEERSKGNELTRAAAELIEGLPCFDPQSPSPVGRFLGYSEGKELFKGQVDVVVTDGFVGNLVLKSVEGLGSAVVSILKSEAKRNPITSIGFLLSASVFATLKRKLDYAEYGAAPLLGVAGYAFICHGRSRAKAIKNALLRTQSAIKSRYVEKLEMALNATSAGVRVSQSIQPKSDH